LSEIGEFIGIESNPAVNERRLHSLEYIGGFPVSQLNTFIRKMSREELQKPIEISDTAIRRFFFPPNQNFMSAEIYKSIFNIKQIGYIDEFNLR